MMKHSEVWEGFLLHFWSHFPSYLLKYLFVHWFFEIIVPYFLKLISEKAKIVSIQELVKFAFCITDEIFWMSDQITLLNRFNALDISV